MRKFSSLSELVAARGEQLGTSEWVTITQDAVNQFADATGDHQWIHVDPERAKGGPFGGTIAHGFLTLSLLPVLMHQAFTVDGITMAINYGVNKVRFPAPVPVGSRVRGTCTLLEATEVGNGTVQLTIAVTVETEDGSKPACVAESILRYTG